MPQIKFYMNNPCVIIREVTEDFSEIKLHPKYTDGLSGSQWCMPCMAGSSDGSHPSHSCEEYQDVIDEINDSESSIIVMAENRLINDKPVEFKALDQVRATINEIKEEISKTRDISKEATIMKGELLNSIISLKSDIESKEAELENTNNECVKLSSRLNSLASSFGEKDSSASLIIGGLTLSMNISSLKSMIKDSIILNHLQKGGVDNWEWYGESMPTEDELNASIVSEIQSLKIENVT